MRAFENLVNSYYGRVYAYACRMVGRELADDVTQDVFLRVYRSLDAFRHNASFTTWLYTIVHNVCVDYRRGRRWDDRQALSLEGPETDDEEPLLQRLQDDRAVNPERWVQERELEATLHVGLMRLSDKHRAVVILHDMHGFRYDEIARIVRCSIGTVKSRLYYARRALRKDLQSLLDNESLSPGVVASSPPA